MLQQSYTNNVKMSKSFFWSSCVADSPARYIPPIAPTQLDRKIDLDKTGASLGGEDGAARWSSMACSVLSKQRQIDRVSQIEQFLPFIHPRHWSTITRIYWKIGSDRELMIILVLVVLPRPSNSGKRDKGEDGALSHSTNDLNQGAMVAQSWTRHGSSAPSSQSKTNSTRYVWSTFFPQINFPVHLYPHLLSLSCFGVVVYYSV